MRSRLVTVLLIVLLVGFLVGYIAVIMGFEGRLP